MYIMIFSLMSNDSGTLDVQGFAGFNGHLTSSYQLLFFMCLCGQRRAKPLPENTQQSEKTNIL
jgi:hypothetical protein